MSRIRSDWSLLTRRQAGRLIVHISDDTERQLRIRIAEMGGKKGDLSRFVEEAIKRWLKSK